MQLSLLLCSISYNQHALCTSNSYSMYYVLDAWLKSLIRIATKIGVIVGIGWGCKESHRCRGDQSCGRAKGRTEIGRGEGGKGVGKGIGQGQGLGGSGSGIGGCGGWRR